MIAQPSAPCHPLHVLYLALCCPWLRPAAVVTASTRGGRLELEPGCCSRVRLLLPWSIWCCFPDNFVRCQVPELWVCSVPLLFTANVSATFKGSWRRLELFFASHPAWSSLKPPVFFLLLKELPARVAPSSSVPSKCTGDAGTCGEGQLIRSHFNLSSPLTAPGSGAAFHPVHCSRRGVGPAARYSQPWVVGKSARLPPLPPAGTIGDVHQRAVVQSCSCPLLSGATLSLPSFLSLLAWHMGWGEAGKSLSSPGMGFSCSLLQPNVKLQFLAPDQRFPLPSEPS